MTSVFVFPEMCVAHRPVVVDFNWQLDADTP